MTIRKIKIVQRCLICGGSNCVHVDTPKIVVKSRNQRCPSYESHTKVRVYGVHSWKYLCTKCGAMFR